MKKLLFIAVLISLLSTVAVSAQVYKKVGDEYVRVDTVKTKAVDTGSIIKIKRVIYPVYRSPKGKFYIIRTSEKTGKEYKQYIKIEG